MTRLREAVQEEKAILTLQLHQLCRRPPPELGSASIEATRVWLHRHRVARAVKGSLRSSRNQLRRAIELMAEPVGGRAP